MKQTRKITNVLFGAGLVFLLCLVFLLSVAAQDPTCVQAPSGLVSWWPGDDHANDIWDANHGTEMNGATYSSGMVGQAFSLDGSDDYVSIPHSPDLNPQNAITLDAWIFVDSYVTPGNITNHPSIISKGNVGYLYDESYALYISPNGNLGFLINRDGTGPGRTNILGPIIPLFNWVHVAGTYDGTTMRMYVNGQLVVSNLHSGGMFYTPDYPVLIGKSERQNDPRGLQSSFFDGKIDEVEVFDCAITQPEIQAIFDADTAGKCKVITVNIDIKPGSDPNSINLGDHGLLPVAILGSPEFDVTTIDPETIGIEGVNLASRGSAKAPKLACSYEDVNVDGYLDMMAFFDVQDLVTAEVLTDTTIELTITGNLFEEHGGTLIEGTDSVNIVP